MPQKPSTLLQALQGSLPPDSYTAIEGISKEAASTGMSLFVVGGAVRDVLLGVPVKDMDLVVEGDAATLAADVANKLCGEVSSYSQFGTAVVRVSGLRFDLATARQEVYVRPGALPKVTPGTIYEDLGRRDFSVNALAITMSGPETGLLLDPHDGQQDLNRGLIRVLHPGSFLDDPTRLFRAIRYEQRLDFQLEDETLAAMSRAVDRGSLDTVSGARIRRELQLVFEEEQPLRPLSRCGELGILRSIHPPLRDGAGPAKLAGHAAGGFPLAYLAALSYNLTAQEGETFTRRLVMPARWAKIVRDTITVREMSVDGAQDGAHGISPAELYSALEKVSLISVEVNALLSDSRLVRDALNHYISSLRYVKPILRGIDLIGLGVPEGPRVGEILGQLKVAKIDGKALTREDEVRMAKTLGGLNGT